METVNTAQYPEWLQKQIDADRKQAEADKRERQARMQQSHESRINDFKELLTARRIEGFTIEATMEDTGGYYGKSTIKAHIPGLDFWLEPYTDPHGMERRQFVAVTTCDVCGHDKASRSMVTLSELGWFVQNPEWQHGCPDDVEYYRDGYREREEERRAFMEGVNAEALKAMKPPTAYPWNQPELTEGDTWDSMADKLLSGFVSALDNGPFSNEVTVGLVLAIELHRLNEYLQGNTDGHGFNVNALTTGRYEE